MQLGKVTKKDTSEMEMGGKESKRRKLYKVIVLLLEGQTHEI